MRGVRKNSAISLVKWKAAIKLDKGGSRWSLLVCQGASVNQGVRSEQVRFQILFAYANENVECGG